jgi:hypothetical protein
MGIALVSFGSSDSSDGSPSPEDASRTQIENEPEVATPSGEPSSGAVPATPSRPSDPTGVDDELAPAPNGDLASGEAPGPASSGPVDPADPPPGDAATADPPSAPLQLGTAAQVGNRYVVAMTAVDLDATDIIVAEDPSNQPPAVGDTYVMVTLEVEFTGLVGEVEPYFDLLVGAVADDGRQFDDLACVALAPDDMYGAPLIRPGEAVVGTFCLAVPTDITDNLTFFVEENESSADTRVWWSVVEGDRPQDPRG